MSSLSVIIPSNNPSKCDMVVETVLSRILDKTYQPGDHLPAENQLAEEFGVSRATIREAFKKLNMLNVVSIRQGDGTIVKKVDAGLLFRPIFSTLLFEDTNISQLYDARRWIEMAAVSMACRNKTPEHLKELYRLTEEMDRAIQAEDPRGYVSLDDQLHLYLFQMAGNFALSSIYVLMRDLIRLHRRQSLKTVGNMQVSHRRHHSILEAIADGDDEVAVALMSRHIEVCKEQILEQMQAGQETESTTKEESL